MSRGIASKVLAVLLALSSALVLAQTKINLGTQAIGGTNLGTALIQSNGTSALTAYAGTSCTNQFVRSFSAVAIATCATVANTDLANSSMTLAGHVVALGGTQTFSASDVGLGNVTNDAQTKAAIVPNTAPASGQALIGNAGGTAYAPQTISGDCTAASTGAWTCTKTNSVAFAASATTDTTNASNISTGSLALGRIATIATNTVLGNATSGTAVPTALAVGGCSSSSSALTWTTNTGFGCNTSIAANTVTTNANLSGDVTSSGNVTTNVNLPDGVTQAGSLLHTNIAAPASPAAGKVKSYSDSTDLRFHDKNASGTIGTTVVADAGASNNFLTAISAAGVISKARPSYANLSSGVNLKVGSFTIDVSTSGTQSVTGVGFKPRVLIFTSMIAAGTAFSIGIDDGTTAFLQATYDTVTVSNYTSNETQSIWGINDNTVANYNLAHVTSLDSDGFTITKTKTGTPTGTCTVHFLAIN